MENIIRLYKTGDNVNVELALSLFNGLSTYQCIRLMIRLGWKVDGLKRLRRAPWFNSWQYHAQSNFTYIINVFGIEYFND